MKARLFLPFLFLVIFSLLLLSADALPKNNAPLSLSSGDENAVVTISLGEGHGARSFQGKVFDGMTLADALTVAGRTGNFDVYFTEDGRSIALNGNDGPWQVEQNGRMVDASLLTTTLTPGDKIAVRALGEQ